MIILDYDKKNHAAVIRACVAALRQGKTVVYPTETSYGLACDVTNLKALENLYKVKLRAKRQPTHVIPPSVAMAKRLGEWNMTANRLAKAFWPGPLTLVLPVKSRARWVREIGGGTGTIGLRLPDNRIAADLAKKLGRPISAASANPSGKQAQGYDSYSAEDVIKQFSRQRHKPGIIINAGKLPHRKPSTLVKITGKEVEILRPGPVTLKQILNAIGNRV